MRIQRSILSLAVVPLLLLLTTSASAQTLGDAGALTINGQQTVGFYEQPDGSIICRHWSMIDTDGDGDLDFVPDFYYVHTIAYRETIYIPIGGPIPMLFPIEIYTDGIEFYPSVGVVNHDGVLYFPIGS